MSKYPIEVKMETRFDRRYKDWKEGSNPFITLEKAREFAESWVKDPGVRNVRLVHPDGTVERFTKSKSEQEWADIVNSYRTGYVSKPRHLRTESES